MTEQSRDDFYEAMAIEESKMRSLIRHLREHKYEHEARHIETKHKMLRELMYAFDAVFIKQHTEVPKFDFES